MKRTAVVLALIAAAFFVGSALAQSTPEQIPVSFQLLANDGNVYANGWYVDGAVIVEDPDDKLDVVALACCQNACAPEETANFPTLAPTDQRTFVPPTETPEGATETPEVSSTPGPTETVNVSPTLEPTQTPVPTEKEGCNRGIGNGSEGCDPGNSGGRPGSAGEGNE